MKTAIVIGHTKNRKGACSPYGIPCEFDFNKKIAMSVLTKNPDVEVFENGTYKYGYKYMVQRTANRINRGNFDLVLELHYNAAPKQAHGCEALYYFANGNAKKLGQYFNNLMETMGYRKRGVKALLTKYDRGFWAVYLPRPTALILEPFFGTNENDVDLMKGHEKDYVNIILDLIENYKSIIGGL